MDNRVDSLPELNKVDWAKNDWAKNIMWIFQTFEPHMDSLRELF